MVFYIESGITLIVCTKPICFLFFSCQWRAARCASLRPSCFSFVCTTGRCLSVQIVRVLSAVCVGCTISPQSRKYITCSDCVIVALLGIFMLFVASKLRSVHDGFNLKPELKVIVLLSIGTVIPVLPLRVGSLTGDTAQVIAESIRSLLIHALISSILDYPLWRSYHLATPSHSTSTTSTTKDTAHHHLSVAYGSYPANTVSEQVDEPSEITDSILRGVSTPLRDILLDPKHSHILRSFRKHLVSEFSVEGLLFYLHAHQFRHEAHSLQNLEQGGSGESEKLYSEASRDTSQETLASKAMKIFCEFLDKDALTEVRSFLVSLKYINSTKEIKGISLFEVFAVFLFSLNANLWCWCS